MAGTAKEKQLEVYVSKTEEELLAGDDNVLGLSSDRNTIVFNGKVVGSGSNIRYKRIQISTSTDNPTEAGWYRFAVNTGGFAAMTTAIIGIERSYSSRKDEHYIFASTMNHVRNGHITQLSGYNNGGNAHLITKIRFAQKTSTSGGCYLDFYTTALSPATTEMYYLWIIGNWDLLDIYKVDDVEEDSATYGYKEVETSVGFNLDDSSLSILRNKILSKLGEATANIKDSTYISTSDATGETGTWYKRKATTLWNYIKSKLSGADVVVNSLSSTTDIATQNVTASNSVTAPSFSGKFFKTIHYISESYKYHVILLGKVTMGGAEFTAVGKLWTRMSGVDRFTATDIAIHVSNNLATSDWSESTFYLMNCGDADAGEFKLIQCTYEGEQYWALQLLGVQQRYIQFTGYDINVLWTTIEYYNSNTQEVLNQEIYDSIVDKTELLQVPTIGGNRLLRVGDTATSAAALKYSRTIDGVYFNGSSAITHYGTCSTEASTAAKSVALTGFALVTRAEVTVRFTVTNTASNPTLNVNSTGAKAIRYRNAAITANYLAANRTYKFVYDGTYWQLEGDVNTDTNTKATQYVTTTGDSGTDAEYPLLFTYSSGLSSSSTNYARFASKVTFNPKTQTITAENFNGIASKSMQHTYATSTTDTSVIRTEMVTLASVLKCHTNSKIKSLPMNIFGGVLYLVRISQTHDSTGEITMGVPISDPIPIMAIDSNAVSGAALYFKVRYNLNPTVSTSSVQEGMLIFTRTSTTFRWMFYGSDGQLITQNTNTEYVLRGYITGNFVESQS